MSESVRNQITLLLQNAQTSDGTTEQLLPLVYEELRKLAVAQMAEENPGQTLQPTALVHEAFLRLVGNKDLSWEGRGHFFAAAARSMRQILINRAVQKKSEKHGGEFSRQDLNEAFFAEEPPPLRVLALDSALERLENMDARKGQIVMLRYFAGLTIEDTAKAMGLSPATVKREWQFARTWLYREMTNIEH